MTVTFILTLSSLLQFIAAIMAFRLIPLTGRRLAWSLISAALLLMSLRRGIPLFRMLSGDTTFRPDFNSELIGLTISLLMVVGISMIAPIFTERKQAEDALKRSKERLRKALGMTVQAVAAVVETRDHYIAGHQRKVSDLARAIAQEMGLPYDQVNGLRMAAIIHDIGKISVPSEILSKPTKLTDIEFRLIKLHPQSGYDILKDVEFPWPIARMVLEHHERINGTGYPNALTGEKLLIESRILAVADVVEAMASNRPYRPAIGIDAAVDEIAKNRATLYDPQAVDACLRLFQEKGYKFRET
jgi:HD-GYP domain-containing protein (c-di-GMP phosphodiesterase class II)